LIDDVATSWTTFNEIAKVLKQNWAKKVIWVCVASH
jgi:predicted amidophosphoribosyltransferase